MPQEPSHQLIIATVHAPTCNGGSVCRQITFHGSDAFAIPPGRSVSLDCQAGRAELGSYSGQISLGEGSSLTLKNCTASTFLPGDAAAVPANAIAPLSLFGSATNSNVRVEDSFLEAPCSVCLHPSPHASAPMQSSVEYEPVCSGPSAQAISPCLYLCAASPSPMHVHLTTA